MPRPLQAPYAHLADWVRTHPLAAAVLAGAFVRLVAATVGLSFHARDDYFHVLDPALHWLADPSFDWDHSSLAGAGIRSHLLPRLVWLILLTTRHLGLANPSAELSVVYALVGAYSLLVVPATWKLTRRLGDARTAMIAAFLAALYFAMPYVGTRLLIESLAMPPLVYGLYLATWRTPRRLLLAGLFVGLACWARFQVGVAAIGLALVVGVRAYRDGRMRALVGELAPLAMGGITAVAIQGLFDLATTGRFLGPLIANIEVNLHPHAELSRSTPLAYVGLWLVLTLPPATFILAWPLVRSAKRWPLVSVPWLVFVLFHSLVPHKEERFMIPVLPLFLVLLAAVPMELRDLAGRFGAWSRRLWPATRAYVLVVGGLFLVVATTSQSQANLRQAMQRVGSDPGARALLVVGPEAQTFFLGDRELPVRRTGKLDARWLYRTLDGMRDEGEAPNRFLVFEPELGKLELLLAARGFDCDAPERIDGWWIDRLIYRVNPRRNRRRSPIALLRCHEPQVALLRL